MKSFFCFVFGLVFFSPIVNSQSYLPGELNGQIVFESAENTGSITVKATGFAKTKAESVNNASAGAMYTLLFRGITGSPNSLPMVPDENGKKNDPAVLSLLNEGFAAYITKSLLISEVVKKRKQDGIKGKQTTSRLTINTDALRRYLEQNGVIRKFGI
jgi:hypothetical protein